MSRLARLKAATSLSDVAKLLDFKPKAVSFILYKQPAATKYTTFQIPKRNSGQRTIKAPVDSLKLLQRRLSGLLLDCVDEINVTGPGLTEPVVIILYDNDTGAKSIRNAIKNASHVTPTGNEPFVHVVKNLYAAATPLPAGTATSKIEDFFDAATKATVIDGKTFNDGNGFDVDKHYGKKVFAHKVVRPKADALDFGGFRPLLANLVAAINKHKASVAAPAPPP